MSSFAKHMREDLILLGLTCRDRDDALKQITSMLEEKGIVKDTYYEALLAREADFPTGLPIGELNFALPHTYPEHVNEVAITLATLKEPVMFREMGDDENEVPVSVIVNLAMKKMDDNVKLLPELMDFFANGDNLRTILEMTDPAEVYAFIKNG